MFAPLIIKDTPYKLTPIFVSEEQKAEFEKIENCTKKEIENKILDIMRDFDEQQQNLYYEYFQKEVKNKTKEKFVNFYQVLEDVYNNNIGDNCDVEDDLV